MTLQWKWKARKNLDSTSVLGGLKEIKSVQHFHQSLPNYAATPLVTLNSLAAYLELADVYVKDESSRLGLKSFKVLGSSYALAKYLGGFHENMYGELNTFHDLKEKIKSHPKKVFATATAGNHGLGLAWAAKQFNQQAIIYLPKGSSANKQANIKALGAEAEITSYSYDDTVRYVNHLSQQNGWVVVQDTSWEGYEAIPKSIMQGYFTLVAECMDQFKSQEKAKPTHVILQAGVGSFAGAIAEGIRALMDAEIKIILVEPDQADGLFQSACSEDGSIKHARGNLSTMMSGLACKEPNPLAWKILKESVDCFVICPDRIAAKGMRIFGNPLGSDPRIISGESGAVPLGLLVEICKNPQYKDLKKTLRLNSDARCLLINTEGDTDPENYRSICWDG